MSSTTTTVDTSTLGKFVCGKRFDQDGLLLIVKNFKEAGYPSGPVGLF